jgi:hypothetical protein
MVTPVRLLTLGRRRSRVPWIYLLYHRDPDSPGAADGPGAASPAAAAVDGSGRRPVRSFSPDA